MRLRSLLNGVRQPLTVTLSLAVVAVGFMPLEVPASANVTSRRIIARPARAPVFTPVEMEIPRLGVRSPVVTVWTEADGTMGSPGSGVDVGWWGGRKPGEGNALFDAHVDWSGRPGPFNRLHELQPGDPIIVRGDGGQVTYTVVWSQKLDRNIDASDVLGNGGGEQVATLITCFGPFDRSIGTRRDRLVVRAALST